MTLAPFVAKESTGQEDVRLVYVGGHPAIYK